MKNQSIAIKIGNFLYNHCFGLYKIIYPVMKNRQDAVEIELMKSAVNLGDTVLDIGANIGFFSRLLSLQVGAAGRVYAFEPDAENFAHLKKAVGAHANVSLTQAAVGDVKGTVTLYRSPMLNVDHRTYPIDGYLSKSTVESIAVDDFLPADTVVRFIKMDIQGFEYMALQGMKNTLMKNVDSLKMIMELWSAGLKKAGASALQVVDFLNQCGYRVYLIEGRKLTLLDAGATAKINDLGEDVYFNVFVKKE
ncbi:MAG: FkbM family methyltransferase [Prevotellaceae bacterium]|jgi:FkbM family methyltransferase|nr:FkbM family methyltransferase [Prevotellaceae bacterium]